MRNIDMPDVNRVIIAGNLVHDPPLRWTKKGVPVSNFIISTAPETQTELDDLNSDKSYVSVVVWAQKAVYCHQHLHKGCAILVIGELQSMPNHSVKEHFYPIQINAKWIQILEEDHRDDFGFSFDDDFYASDITTF